MTRVGLRERLRGSLRTRVYLLLAVSALGPTAIVAWAFASRVAKLDEQLLASRQWAARATASQVEEELNQALEVLQRAATAPHVNLEDADPGPERAALGDPRIRAQFPGGAFFLGASGERLVEEPERGSQSVVPPPDLPDVKEAVQSGRPAVTSFVGPPGGERIYALVPVRNWEGRVTGIAGGVVDPAQSHLSVLLRYLRRSPEGTAELVDRSGRVILSTDAGRARHPSGCGEAARVVAERKAVAALCRDCHPGRQADERGRAVLAAAPVMNASWAVLARLPEKDVLASSGAFPGWLATLTGAVLGLGAILAWGAARSITEPVSRLTSAAERIASGDLTGHIQPAGFDEVARLAQALEKMRESLRDLIGIVATANQQLEKRVEERTAELAQVNAQLRERERALANLYEKVVAAQEDERKRIARELHDDTSQSLAVLVMALDGAMATLKAGGVPRLEEAKALAVRTIEEVHRMILDLRPSVLDDLGLLSAIRWYAERHLAPRGLSVRCEFEAKDRRLPAAFETAVFRVCQEAMSNIARHAQAESVLIQVSESGGALHIEIEDDGRGFDPENISRAHRRPFGLMGIRERVELLGGQVRIDSAPGKGTRLHIDVPVPPEG
ncbi:MAG TPA: ATP-binding protein [Anaeromyxobacteraceae bacterium]|nr:ATP-binding protein [Anaeromyxobacteraceae bacterium]